MFLVSLRVCYGICIVVPRLRFILLMVLLSMLIFMVVVVLLLMVIFSGRWLVWVLRILRSYWSILLRVVGLLMVLSRGLIRLRCVSGLSCAIRIRVLVRLGRLLVWMVVFRLVLLWVILSVILGSD